MHRDENATSTSYWAVNLDALQEHQFAYLGRDWEDFYFVRKMDWEYIIKRVVTLDDSDMSDRMREWFDAHDAWVDAVRNGDTDESYDSWQQDIDIRDEEDPDNYHECHNEIVDILQNLGLWGSPYSSYNGNYLDEDYTRTITNNNLDEIYRRLDTNDIFNEQLWLDLEKKYGLHQIEFLAAEPIR